jgi:hypothetical protein
LTRTLKSMEKGLIIRKKTLKMVAVYWFTLLILVKKKENYLKNTVLKFNETVKQHISEENCNTL